MRLEARSTATARQLAELHKDLALAVLAVRRTFVRNEHPLTLKSSDALGHYTRALEAALSSLDTPWRQRAGVAAPSANASQPELWCTYLDVKGRMK